MATPNRWAVREAAEVTFYDLTTKDAIVTLKTLKMSEIQTTGETSYARGGRGNAKLVGFSSDREAKITLQDAIFDNLALAMLTGNQIATGKRTVDMIHEATITTTDGTITLPKTPKSITTVYVLDSDNVTNKAKLNSTTGTPTDIQYKATGTSLSFHDGNKGKKVRVYYTWETDETAKTVKVTADKFGGTFKVVCDVMVRDADTKKDFDAQLIIPNAKIEDDFSFNFSPDGDPSVLDIPLEILKDPASQDMWQLVIFDN